MKPSNDVRPGRGGEADAFTPPAGPPPVAAEDHAPVPQQRRRLGGLAAGPNDSALDRALDSINVSWVAEVSVAKSLAVPVGLMMGIGWLAGSFALTTGVLGIALFVAGFLTLLHAWLNHHDAPGVAMPARRGSAAGLVRCWASWRTWRSPPGRCWPPPWVPGGSPVCRRARRSSRRSWCCPRCERGAGLPARRRIAPAWSAVDDAAGLPVISPAASCLVSPHPCGLPAIEALPTAACTYP